MGRENLRITTTAKGVHGGTYCNKSNLNIRKSKRWHSAAETKIPYRPTYETLERERQSNVQNYGGWDFGFTGHFGQRKKEPYDPWKWRWSNGYNNNRSTSKRPWKDRMSSSVPVYNDVDLDVMDVPEEDANPSSNWKPNLPVEKVCRTLVEDDKPKRNFGDYDPVNPRYLPSSNEFRGPLPIKMDKRRILFKGIGENHLKLRLARQQQGLEHDWRHSFNQKYDEHFLGDALDDTDNESVVIKAEKYDSETESIYTPPCSPIRTQDDTHSLDEQCYSGSTRNYTDLRDTNSGRFSSDINSKMLGKKWYEVDESQSINFGETDEDKYVAMKEHTKGFHGGNSSTARAEGFGAYHINIHASPNTQDYGLSSSRNYNKGTENLRSSYAERSVEEPYPAKYQNVPSPQGYTSTNASQDVNPSDLKRNENLFCEKVSKFNYFYRLKRIPTEENQGVRFFGFELEFWPKEDPIMKEVVLGLQMTDPVRAKDSVFAAALKLLTRATENKNAGRSPFKERVDSNTSAHKCYPSRLNFEQEPVSKGQGTSFSLKEDLRDAHDSVQQNAHKKRYPTEMGKDYEYDRVKEKQETRRADHGDKGSKQTDSFRIAIPRGPSIIDEQFKNRKIPRHGFGFNNRY